VKTEGLKPRVIRAAERVLEVKGVVSPIELLKQMQFLAPSHVRMWEKGVHACLYPQIQCGSNKLAQTFQIFTQWAKKHSALSAVVVQFNRRRKRYERRGLLATRRAIEQAEKECLSDAEQRAAQRERGRVQREREDEHDVNAEMFCPRQ